MTITSSYDRGTTARPGESQLTRTPHYNRLGFVRSGILTLTVIASTLSVSSIAEAGPRTSSDAIADEAADALDSLENWQRTENPADLMAFIRGRDMAAVMTAYELQVDPESMRAAWAHADWIKQHAVLAALSQLGVPYRTRASKEGVAFDCSGLTSYAYDEAGVDIERVSRNQINAAHEIELIDAEPGDLVYYPGHVSMYLGVETMIHSPNTGSHVEAAQLPDRSLRFGDVLTAG